ncbi:MAG: helix-turn-helix domain-containing protein [Candidatus Afipia apatlaquensis]|uniref:Helix-turn-helix domain-containing protein n=1 Tax=Candidatus Afipia apatlaquensis TaxID=2712852 RepID=A0A7C9VHX6_9BRAD|nr:helix-turn-helix domain-containing protein [Candidatus Afipia apatlaquensis]
MLDIVKQAAKRAGGLAKLAGALGIKHQSFYSWDRIPASRVLEIERASGISRSVLRPDLYPVEEAAQ